MEKTDLEHLRSGQCWCKSPSFAELPTLDIDVLTTDRPHKPSCTYPLPQDVNSSGYLSNYSDSDRASYVSLPVHKLRRDSLASTCSSDQGVIQYINCSFHFSEIDSPCIGRPFGNLDGSVHHSLPDCREDRSEDFRGGLAHGILPAHQEVFEYFAPQLMQHMDPMSLHPYLLRHGLISHEDVDYICNPHRTDRERRSRILHAAPYKDPQAFKYFLQSLSEEPEHIGHQYLAKRMRQALEKKRQNPYTRLSSLMPQPSQHFDTEKPDGHELHHFIAPTTSTPKPKRVRAKSATLTTAAQPRFHNSPSSYSVPREGTPDAVLHSPTAKPETHFLPEGTSASSVRMSLCGSDDKLAKKKLDWLQKRVHFKDCPEFVRFRSKTHFCEDREILYSGILYEHGKPVFVVLFTDMLLVLKVKKPHGSWKLFTSLSKLEWFADREYSTKRPLQLHLLTVKQQRKQDERKEICLHYKNEWEVKEICLVACSVEARNVWVEQLSDAIVACTVAHAETVLPMGIRVPKTPGRKPYPTLMVEIQSLRLVSTTLAEGRHSVQMYCKLTVGATKCRTPATSSMPPTWNFSNEFLVFSVSENLLIELYNENVFQPDDLIGSVEVSLSSLPKDQVPLLLKCPNHDPMGKLEVQIEFG